MKGLFNLCFLLFRVTNYVFVLYPRTKESSHQANGRGLKYQRNATHIPLLFPTQRQERHHSICQTCLQYKTCREIMNYFLKCWQVYYDLNFFNDFDCPV